MGIRSIRKDTYVLGNDSDDYLPGQVPVRGSNFTSGACMVRSRTTNSGSSTTPVLNNN